MAQDQGLRRVSLAFLVLLAACGDDAETERNLATVAAAQCFLHGHGPEAPDHEQCLQLVVASLKAQAALGAGKGSDIDPIAVTALALSVSNMTTRAARR